MQSVGYVIIIKIKNMKIYEFDPVIYPYKVWIVIGKNPHKLKYCFVGSDGNELNDIYEETDSFKAFNVTVIGGSHSNHGVVMFFRNKHQLKNYSLVAHESSHVAKRFAYMRSGTCTNLKFSTNVSVPFIIYAVMLSLRFINEKLKSKHRSSIYFLCGGKN